MRAEVNDILHRCDSVFALSELSEKSEGIQGVPEAPGPQPEQESHPDPQPEQRSHPEPDLSAVGEAQVKVEPPIEDDCAGAPDEHIKEPSSRAVSTNSGPVSSPVKAGSSQEAVMDDMLQQHIRETSEMPETDISQRQGSKESTNDIAKYDTYFVSYFEY